MKPIIKNLLQRIQKLTKNKPSKASSNPPNKARRQTCEAGSTLNGCRKKILESPQKLARGHGFILLEISANKNLLIGDRFPHANFLHALSESLGVQPDIRIIQTDHLKEWAKLTYGEDVNEREKSGEPFTVDNNTSALIDTIFYDAIRFNASDFYLELNDTSCKSFYRVSGRLTKKSFHTLDWGRNLLARLKILANLNLDKTGKPQEGRFRYTLSQKQISCRLSFLASETNESLVVRLLSNDPLAFTLDRLGMPEPILQSLKKLSNAEMGGMLLITGPTGSGKTTTLYSLLQFLNSESRKILTLEDPVEAEIEGVVQTEVNENLGLSFESGLKALLRQDPNVIMLGEIRDKATAAAAVQSALSGHLLLTTVHAKSTIDVFFRCLELGIERATLATSLLGILNQRLLPALCLHCRKSFQAIEGSTYPAVSENVAPFTVNHRGCEKCQHTGYFGRRALFEWLPLSNEIGNGLINGLSPSELNGLAQNNGLLSFSEHKKMLVNSGLIAQESCEMGNV